MAGTVPDKEQSNSVFFIEMAVKLGSALSLETLSI